MQGFRYFKTLQINIKDSKTIFNCSYIGCKNFIIIVLQKAEFIYRFNAKKWRQGFYSLPQKFIIATRKSSAYFTIKLKFYNYHLPFAILPTTNTIHTNRTAQIAEIHIGENTHIQDHSITLATFKIINRIVRNDTIPIPPFRAFFLSIYYSHNLIISYRNFLKNAFVIFELSI